MDLLKRINKIDQFAGRLKGQKVFLRVDFNMPIQDGKVADDYRIKAALSTLDFLKQEGAITILASHIETADIEKPTLQPVFDHIKAHYTQFDFDFCVDFANASTLTDAVSKRGEGTFLLLENIRHSEGEKTNDVNLALYLKDFADFYVSDAFAVVHRTHCSVDALPKLFDIDHKAAGFLLAREIEELSKGIIPAHPFVAVLSGMKFSTKLPLIQKYLATADRLFIAGALFNNIAKSLDHEVGVSLVDKDAAFIDALVVMANFKHKVFVPEMVAVRDMQNQEVRVSRLDEVKPTESIQDIAEISVQKFFQDIQDVEAKTILWNGPIGNYEDADFSKGTAIFAKDLYEYIRNHPDTHALIGGGDTVAAIQHIPDFDKTERIFVSTGGGAMLEFLEKEGHLPGIMSLI